MTNEELARAVAKARERASASGSMSALWDVIFDGEAILSGGQSICARPDVEKALADFLTSEIDHAI